MRLTRIGDVTYEIIVPYFGANIDEGRLVQWLKKVGEHVTERDGLCYYETSKATFEIEAEHSGYLLRTLHTDDIVPVLSLIGYLGDSPNESIIERGSHE